VAPANSFSPRFFVSPQGNKILNAAANGFKEITILQLLGATNSMQNNMKRLISLAILYFLLVMAPKANACNCSEFTLINYYYDTPNQEWVIETMLRIGSGLTGVTAGANDGTRNFAIGFYRAAMIPALSLNSWSPQGISNTNTVPNCSILSTNLANPPGALIGARLGVFYLVPATCTNGFTCISSTGSCGNIACNDYPITFRTNQLPDSLRAFGIEGANSLTGGCYMDADMLITFCQNPSATITCPSSNTVLNANSGCMGIVPDYSNTLNVVTNCVNITYTQTPAIGTILSLGSTNTVTVTAQPQWAAPATNCSFQVNVVDQTPPLINCPGNATLALDAACNAVLADYTTSATTSDNCTATPTTTQSPAIGASINGTASTTVTLTTTDGSGNTGTCAFTVTTVDNISPTINCPANIMQTAAPYACDAVVTWSNPTTADNCSSVSTSSTMNSGDTFVLGATTVDYTTTDGSGNTASCSFVVTVNQAPYVDSIALSSTFNCNGDTVMLTASATVGNYLWSTAETTPSIEATVDGWYWVDLSNTSGCVVRDSIYLTFLPFVPPVVNTSGNLLCTGTHATYQWLLNGIPISGATSQCYTIAVAGNYSVTVSDSNGCTATSLRLGLVNNTPMNDGGLEIYPNPAQDILYLRFQQAVPADATVTLYDVQGKVLRQMHLDGSSLQVSFPLGGISDGTYLLEVKGEGLAARRHVVKME
jgi:hypothetical protein